MSFLDGLNPNIKALIGLAAIVGSILGVGEKFGAAQQEMVDQIRGIEIAINGRDGIKEHVNSVETEVKRHGELLSAILGSRAVIKSTPIIPDNGER